MALEDRDWFREKPSEAWRKMFPKRGGPPDGGAKSPTAGGTSASNKRPAGMQMQPQRVGPRRRKSFVRGWIAPLVLALAAGAGYAAWQNHALPWQTRESAVAANPAPPLAIPATKAAPRPGLGIGSRKVIRFRSRRGLDTPASRVTRWSVTDPRFGRVSVYVPVGTTPREALTRALAAKGYQVLP